MAHSSDPNGGRSVGRDQCSEQPLLKSWTNSGVYCERCGKIVFEQSIQPLWPTTYTPLSLVAPLQPVYLASLCHYYQLIWYLCVHITSSFLPVSCFTTSSFSLFLQLHTQHAASLCHNYQSIYPLCPIITDHLACLSHYNQSIQPNLNRNVVVRSTALALYL